VRVAVSVFISGRTVIAEFFILHSTSRGIGARTMEPCAQAKDKREKREKRREKQELGKDEG
jgi:hypothetical protein